MKPPNSAARIGTSLRWLYRRRFLHLLTTSRSSFILQLSFLKDTYPAYPAERLELMARDAGIRVLLTSASRAGDLPLAGVAVRLVDPQ
jgi:hypothetical protein